MLGLIMQTMQLVVLVFSLNSNTSYTWGKIKQGFNLYLTRPTIKWYIVCSVIRDNLLKNAIWLVIMPI